MKKFGKFLLVLLLLIVVFAGGACVAYWQHSNINKLLKKEEKVKDGYVIARVGLTPKGIVEEKQIDLKAHPVRIILNNEDNTYQFVFDDNSELKTQKSKSIEIGEYTYTILSEQLKFEDVSGKIEIDEDSCMLNFNYTLTLNQALDFSIEVTEATGNNGNLALHSEPENVELIRNELGNNKTYIVAVYIFDENGVQKANFNHTHSSTGTCSDNWDMSSHLTNNTKYTMQLRFTSQEDSLKTFLSDITDFTYSSMKSYKVTYTVTKN